MLRHAAYYADIRAACLMHERAVDMLHTAALIAFDAIRCRYFDTRHA